MQVMRNNQNNLKNELSWKTNKIYFKMYYKATLIEAVWFWHKYKQINQ